MDHSSVHTRNHPVPRHSGKDEARPGAGVGMRRERQVRSSSACSQFTNTQQSVTHSQPQTLPRIPGGAQGAGRGQEGRAHPTRCLGDSQRGEQMRRVGGRQRER